MKKIKFKSDQKNIYHTIKKTGVDRSETKNLIIEKGLARITFFSLESIDVGDVLSINGISYLIEKINERRNHAGVFRNPEHKLNSFWDVETSYQFEREIKNANK